MKKSTPLRRGSMYAIKDPALEEEKKQWNIPRVGDNNNCVCKMPLPLGLNMIQLTMPSIPRFPGKYIVKVQTVPINAVNETRKEKSDASGKFEHQTLESKLGLSANPNIETRELGESKPFITLSRLGIDIFREYCNILWASPMKSETSAQSSSPKHKSTNELQANDSSEPQSAPNGHIFELDCVANRISSGLPKRRVWVYLLSPYCREMSTERLQFMQHVVSSLRLFCQARFIDFNFVDLRPHFDFWLDGDYNSMQDSCPKTPEFVDLGTWTKKIPFVDIALQQVELCRPFIVSALGSNYDNPLPLQLPESTKRVYPWAAVYCNPCLYEDSTNKRLNSVISAFGLRPTSRQSERSEDQAESDSSFWVTKSTKPLGSMALTELEMIVGYAVPALQEEEKHVQGCFIYGRHLRGFVSGEPACTQPKPYKKALERLKDGLTKFFPEKKIKLSYKLPREFTQLALSDLRDQISRFFPEDKTPTIFECATNQILDYTQQRTRGFICTPITDHAASLLTDFAFGDLSCNFSLLNRASLGFSIEDSSNVELNWALEWESSNDSSLPRCLLGLRGSGKTAMISAWLMGLQESAVRSGMSVIGPYCAMKIMNHGKRNSSVSYKESLQFEQSRRNSKPVQKEFILPLIRPLIVIYVPIGIPNLL